MRRLLLVGALALSGYANAAPWEYATYLTLGSIAQAWSTPAGSVSGKDIDAILDALKCPQRGVTGLLNCVGADGWELVQVVTGDGGSTTNYIFKRPKP
ncbi:DUF4177 domain-containing protein [Deinococcus sp. HMF7604]|uniref:DUF4177 domain-containing protein n=1 Tax=Deinococcus betulae TaxID=2873312 RepID=UPI001CCA5E73|nr:DUF4177 domain-containing protein [Deinococcus betulae]MBZ9753010.1 DUF4177 domain-containing protein [Deinococcus betulae]